MKKNKILAFLGLLLCIGMQSVFADVTISIEINNVNTNGGIIYGYVYFTESAYRNKKADVTFKVNPSNSTVMYELQLPERELMISIFQDNNGNGILDNGLFNVPKEPVGMTNYNGGIPGNFNKLKVNISNNNRRINIPLITF